MTNHNEKDQQLFLEISLATTRILEALKNLPEPMPLKIYADVRSIREKASEGMGRAILEKTA